MLLLLITRSLGEAQSSPVAIQIETAIAEGRRYRSAGHFAEAVKAFERAADQSHRSGDLQKEAAALLSASGCRLRIFQYREALQSSEAAREIATRTGDYTVAGAASGTLSTIYIQLGDFSLAKLEGERTVELLRHSPRQDFLAKALFSYGDIRSEATSVAAGRQSYDQALEVARHARMPNLEAMAEDHMGTSLLLEGDLAEAQTALNAAFEIRVKIHDEDGLAITKEHLAELELRKGNYQLALKNIDEAFASSSLLFKTNPPYYPLHVRGLILWRLHRESEALLTFRRSVDWANRWRQGALPGDATNTRTVISLHATYQDYAQLAAELALRRHDQTLKWQSLEALAANRAATLREQITLAFARNLRLPQHYFELLAELQAAQAQVTLGEESRENEAKLGAINLRLYELENKIGMQRPNFAEQYERNLHKNSLKDIQQRLGNSELLLSFCLGKEKSFLWALTGDQLNLYDIPPESEIGKQVKAFSLSVQNDQNIEVSGRVLSVELFGKLDAQAFKKRDWLISTDGVLLDEVPFPALPSLPPINAPLIGSHTLRFLPSELLLTTRRNTLPASRFVGVADPIYNLADSRRDRSHPLSQANQTLPPMLLARLPGSDREVRSAAQASGITDVQILEGLQASNAALQEAIAKKPEFLHFAVHIVSPEKNPAQAALALSLTKANIPELLTPEAIATYRVPGSLVILSGCSSARGEILPSAGLMGLSRAWLLAGASAVVVSAWPTPDDSGSFFTDFYSHFQRIKSGSLAQRAAISLQQVQLDMSRSTGDRSFPSFWAAYSIVSKE